VYSLGLLLAGRAGGTSEANGSFGPLTGRCKPASLKEFGRSGARRKVGKEGERQGLTDGLHEVSLKGSLERRARVSKDAAPG
jgi:hypothetical protein